jgi:hypothetical protein
VDKLNNGTYLVWTPSYRGIITPKLKYQGTVKGELQQTGIIGQAKSVVINSTVSFSIMLLANLLLGSSLSLRVMLIVLAGVVLFFSALSFFVIYSTKVKVEQQLKSR